MANPFAKMFGVAPDPLQLYGSIANNPLAAELLGQYGLAVPQPSQNIMLPDTGFFGNHPRLSRGIENALLAAANTEPSRTPGEAIANIARGLLNVQPTRDSIQMSRIMAPFAMAQQLQGLQHGAESLKLMQAQENYYNRYSLGLADSAGLPYHSVHVDKNGDMWGVSKATNRLEKIPGGTPGMFAAPGSNMGWGEELSKGRNGLLPDQSKLSPDELKQSMANYNKLWNDQITLAGGKAGATKAAENKVPLRPGELDDVQRDALNTYKRNMQMSYADFIDSNLGGDTSMAAFSKFKSDNKALYDRLISSTTQSSPASSRTSAGSPAAPPSSGNTQDNIVNAFFQELGNSQKARSMATNPQRFLAPGTAPARPSFYDLFGYRPPVNTASFPTR